MEEAYCGMLMFADDMAMVAESEEGMDRMLDKVDAYSRKWRFKFNEKKSKVMVIAGRHRRKGVTESYGHDTDSVSPYL